MLLHTLAAGVRRIQLKLTKAVWRGLNELTITRFLSPARARWLRCQASSHQSINQTFCTCILCSCTYKASTEALNSVKFAKWKEKEKVINTKISIKRRTKKRGLYRCTMPSPRVNYKFRWTDNYAYLSATWSIKQLRFEGLRCRN